MYKAIANFVDLQDNNYKYQAGDNFPREGLEVSKERIEELSTDANRRKAPVIELVPEVVIDEPVVKPIVEPTVEPAQKDVKKPAPKKGGRKKADA